MPDSIANRLRPKIPNNLRWHVLSPYFGQRINLHFPDARILPWGICNIRIWCCQQIHHLLQ